MARRPSNRLVRKAIRELLVPSIEAAGFEGKYGAWQRLTDEEAHFLSITTAKYGGSFGISGAWGNLQEFGDCEPTLAATDFENRAALTRQVDLWRLDGSHFIYRPKMFEYDFLAEDVRACEALVAEAATGLPELFAWFETKRLTDRLDTIFEKLNSVPNPELGRLIAKAKVAQGLY